MAVTHLFMVTAVIEVGAGLVFLVAPEMPVTLLFGPESRIRAALVMGRLAGAALCALGAACWWARHDERSAAARALVGAMLTYNAAVVVLVVSGSLGSLGPPLWAAAVLHGAMAVWCVWSLKIGPSERARSGR